MTGQVRDTQIDSWVRSQSQIGPRQAEVLTVLSTGPRSGFKIARILHIPTYTVLPRITELCDLGKVKDSGGREYNPETRRRVIVWEAAKL